MRPSSNWISSGFHAWLWSKPSGSGLDGFRGRLNRRLWRRLKTLRHKTEDEESIAQSIGIDARRDAATSDSIRFLVMRDEAKILYQSQ